MFRHDPRATDHAYERAEERYGLSLDAHDWQAIVEDIVSVVARVRARALLLRRLVDRPGRDVDYSGAPLEEWLVSCRGHPMFVVYAPGQARIVTVLTPGVSHGRFAKQPAAAD